MVSGPDLGAWSDCWVSQRSSSALCPSRRKVGQHHHTMCLVSITLPVDILVESALEPLHSNTQLRHKCCWRKAWGWYLSVGGKRGYW